MTLSEQNPTTIVAFEKSQTLRLIDVFILGPLLIYAASKTTLTKIDRGLLLASAVGIIFYNGRNYLRNKISTSP